MHTRVMLSLSAAALLALAGCGDGEQSTSPSDTEGQAPSQAEGEAGGSTAMDSVKEKTQAAMDSASEAGSQALEAISEAAGLAQDRGATLTDSAKAEAQRLIERAQTYLEENHLDSAEGIMDQLNALKDSASESMRTEINQLEEQISTARDQENN